MVVRDRHMPWLVRRWTVCRCFCDPAGCEKFGKLYHFFYHTIAWYGLQEKYSFQKKWFDLSDMSFLLALRRLSLSFRVFMLLVYMHVNIYSKSRCCCIQASALSELEEHDDSLPGVILANDMHSFGQIMVGVVAVLKGLSWQGLLATSPQVCAPKQAQQQEKNRRYWCHCTCLISLSQSD